MKQELAKSELKIIVAGVARNSINRTLAIKAFFEYKSAVSNLASLFKEGKISDSRFQMMKNKWEDQYKAQLISLNTGRITISC